MTGEKMKHVRHVNQNIVFERAKHTMKTCRAGTPENQNKICSKHETKYHKEKISQRVSSVPVRIQKQRGSVVELLAFCILRQDAHFRILLSIFAFWSHFNMLLVFANVRLATSIAECSCARPHPALILKGKVGTKHK
jgi:hypothetical protein